MFKTSNKSGAVRVALAAGACALGAALAQAQSTAPLSVQAQVGQKRVCFLEALTDGYVQGVTPQDPNCVK